MEACRRRQALVLHPASSHGVRTGKRLWTPGGGGYCHMWAIQVCAVVQGMVSERLALEQGIIFQGTDQLVEDFIQTRDCGIKVLFWLDCASILSSFQKTATLGQGGLGEFTLVQGSKIQLNYNLGQNKMEQQTPIPSKSRMKAREGQKLACENIRFSSLFVDGNVSRETQPAWQAFEREGEGNQGAPLSFLSRLKLLFLKLPFPSLSNACHAGYAKRCQLRRARRNGCFRRLGKNAPFSYP